MILVFACEHRFVKDMQGKYYAVNQSYGDAIWDRYLLNFESIIIFARVKLDNSDVNNFFEITTPKVSFIEIPYYIGPWGYANKRTSIKKIARNTALPSRAYICRVPGEMGTILSHELRKKQIPYAVEVVGDPWDVFAPGAINHPLSLLFRILGYTTLKKIANAANAALYVTKYQLQKRYPANSNAFITNASDVKNINENILLPKENNIDTQLKLISVGSLSQMYKSPDIAIKSIAILNKIGINCTLRWLGDGKYKKSMKKLANKLGVGDKVQFLGNVSSSQVKEELLNSDIFLHISRTEGLPRAIIEAMSLGLPCIGSRVGGIPELLDDIAIVNKLSPTNVVKKIVEFANDKDLLNKQSKRNFIEAKSYNEIILNKKRIEFYEFIKSASMYFF